MENKSMEELLKHASKEEVEWVQAAARRRAYLLEETRGELPKDWRAELISVDDKDETIWLGFAMSNLRKVSWRIKDTGQVITVYDYMMSDKYSFTAVWEIRRDDGRSIMVTTDSYCDTKAEVAADFDLLEIFSLFRGRELTSADGEEFLNTLELIGISNIRERQCAEFLRGLDFQWDEPLEVE